MTLDNITSAPTLRLVRTPPFEAPLARSLPAARGALPVLGHIPYLFRDLVGFLRGSHESLGNMFWIHNGFRKKDLVVFGELGLSVFGRSEVSSRYLKEELEPIVGESLFSTDGGPHRRMRGALTRPFTPKQLNAANVGAVIQAAIEERVGEWRGQSSIRICGETRELALEIIFRVMGVNPEEFPQWRKHYERFLLAVIRTPYSFPGSPAWIAEKSGKWTDSKIRALLKTETGRDSLIGAFQVAEDSKGQRLSGRELIDNIRVLGFAGHETIASTIAYMVLHLAQREDCWRKLVEEVSRTPTVPTHPKDLAEFPYASALFRESLRLNPPIPLDSRVAEEDFMLGGVQIEAGTRLTVSLANLGRDPATYPEPDEFIPERWFSLSPKPGSMETAQFGAGPHFCLGYHMALMEGIQFAVEFARQVSSWGKQPKLKKNAMPRGIQWPIARPAPWAVIELRSATGGERSALP